MQTGRHHNNFDLLRILAALQVAIVHTAGHLDLQWPPIFNVITMLPGVPIFFVTSGFLVSASFENSPLRTYFVNRALRIYPAMWMCLAVSIVIVALNVPIDAAQFWPWLVAQVTVGQFYNPEFLRSFGVGVLNGSLWTIPVELQFYLIIPLLYRFKLNLPITIAIGIVINCAFVHWADRSMLFKLIGETALPYVYMFLLGVYLQRNRELVQKYLVGQWAWWFLAYLIVEGVTRFLGLYTAGNYLNPLSAITLGCLVISLAHTKPVRIRYDLSYGLYLYHMPILNLFIAHGRRTGIDAVEVIAIALGLAWLSSVLVERPALRLKSRFSTAQPVVVPQ